MSPVAEHPLRTVPAVIRNGLHVTPYVYRGTGFDTLTPELGDAFDEPECPCGETMAGYRKHLKDGEEPCQASRDATNDYHRERSRNGRKLQPHGSDGAVRRHYRGGTPLCEACSERERERSAERSVTDLASGKTVRAVHADRGGRPWCGSSTGIGQSVIAAPGQTVTCRRCIKAMGRP